MAAKPTTPPPSPRCPRSSLEKLFSRALPAYDDASLVALWDRYLDHGAEADFHALVETYAPLARFLAMRMKRRNPDFYREDVEDLTGDGVLGIMHEIREAAGETERRGRMKIVNRIRKFIYRGTISRQWVSRYTHDGYTVARRVRASLTQAEGRVPTPGQMREALAGQVKNPEFFLFPQRGVNALSHERGRGLRDGRLPQPEEAVIDAEIVRLAGKGLDRAEKKMLRFILRGFTPAEVARKTGTHYVSVKDRMNCVIWKARCNAELATYVGFEQQQMPPRVNGHFPTPPAAPWLHATRPSRRAG